MATDTSERLVSVIAALREELVETEGRAAKLRNLIAAAEDFTGAPQTNGQRPPLRQAIVTVMRESGNPGWLLAPLTHALADRGWVGGEKGPSKESVRQALENLQKQGVTVAERQGTDKWSPNSWKLSNKPLSRPADLS
jgi:hypothetical protein